MSGHKKRAWAEIDLCKLERNVNIFRAHLLGNTELMTVIKADAYGHGDTQICAKLYEMGVKHYGVITLDEGIRMRPILKNCEIMILGYVPPEYAEEIAHHDLVQGIVSSNHALGLSNNATKPVRCHIKIDTGMGRVGLKNKNYYECAEEIAKITSMKNLRIEGIYTHYASADGSSPSDIAFTNMQTEYILAVYEELCRRNIHLRHVHFLNSAGFFYHNTPKSTLARIGINLFGLSSNFERDKGQNGLETFLELKAVISQVKTIHKGDSISYGRTFTAQKEMKIASLTIGYADGYSRALSSKGEALVNGVRCKVVGRVCMDQLMLDVSSVPQVKAGDIATLIGRDGSEEIRADWLGSLYGTIPQEVVCGITSRVPRVYI